VIVVLDLDVEDKLLPGRAINCPCHQVGAAVLHPLSCTFQAQSALL